MELEILRIMGEIRNTFARSAVMMLIGALASHFLLPKPTKIIVDEGVPAQLVTLGKEGNPKAVYVTNKEHKLNLLPTVLMAAAAAAMIILKRKYDKENNIISAE